MKKILIILLTLSTLFLSSCIKMDSTLIINDDFTMDGVTTFDYTQLNATADGFSSFGTGTGTEEPKRPCENLQSASGGLSAGDFKEMSCVNVDENIAKVTGKGKSVLDIIIMKDGNYILNLKPIVDSNSADDGKTEEEKIQSINSLKAMGFQMNYIIELPTEIIESNVGKIDGNKLSFDIFEFTKIPEPYVTFKGSSNITADITEDIRVELNSKQSLFKKLILSKKELEKTYKGRNDIAKFETLIPKVDDDKLIDLNDRISNIDKTNSLYKKYENLLNYLDAKIGLEIYNRGLNK